MTNLEEVDVKASGDPHLALVRAPADRNPQRTSDGSWRAAAVALAVALAASVAWLSTSGAPASTIRELPAAKRAAVAERALGNLRDVCTARERPGEFCQEQARLLLGLPECRSDCQALARDVLQAGWAVR